VLNITNTHDSAYSENNTPTNSGVRSDYKNLRKKWQLNLTEE